MRAGDTCRGCPDDCGQRACQCHQGAADQEARSPHRGHRIAGNGNAWVSWTAPASDGGSPVTGYTVTASHGDQTCTTTDTTTCTVTGLTNGRQYTVKVRASNSKGEGPASPRVLVTPSSQSCPDIGPGANLQGCDLYGANLTGANVAGANLTGAILTGVSSGGITGTPAETPSGWVFFNGYFIGAGASLGHAQPGWAEQLPQPAMAEVAVGQLLVPRASPRCRWATVDNRRRHRCSGAHPRLDRTQAEGRVDGDVV